MTQINYADLQIIYGENFLKQILTKIGRSRRHIWHIALPKSGSTWLSNILMLLLKEKNWAYGNLLPFYGKRAQEIDPRYFFLTGNSKTNIFFRHQHCVCSEYTEHLLKSSGTTAFLQVRNIFDVTVSMFDHFRKIINGSWAGSELLPNGCKTWSDSTLLDYIIDIELPWYIKFLDSWLSSHLVINNNIYVTKYEDLVSSPNETIRSILTFAQIENITDEEIENALTMNSKGKGQTLFNKGVIGRGKKILSNTQIERITKYINYYPKTDFSIVT